MAELKYDITPANAPRFAADIVKAAEDFSKANLDYSVASLVTVDTIIEGFRKEGNEAEAIAATLFGFGCYVGEVFVRHAGATWLKSTSEIEKWSGSPLVLRIGEKTFINPIGKVIKRLQNGEEDNLPYFYTAFSRPREAPASFPPSGSHRSPTRTDSPLRPSKPWWRFW